jgi:hypothetical protein
MVIYSKHDVTNNSSFPFSGTPINLFYFSLPSQTDPFYKMQDSRILPGLTESQSISTEEKKNVAYDELSTINFVFLKLV